MKFCYNANFTLPKKFQRSRSILQDGSRSLGLFWKENTLSYSQRNTVFESSREASNNLFLTLLHSECQNKLYAIFAFLSEIGLNMVEKH